VLKVFGNLGAPLAIPLAELSRLERVSLVADFHCVTTWSVRGLRWGGVRFRAFYEAMVTPHVESDTAWVIFHALDGYRARLPLADALAADVLLADELGDEPLGLAHGAPLRVVAPAHYGYKNVKHLSAIELAMDGRSYRSRSLPGQDHPRARVAFEERGTAPAWLLRLVYRPFVQPIVSKARRAILL
jgi:DMSO/TMAO reductase YedYZ molybdopterin-dependent catalytic subunit